MDGEIKGDTLLADYAFTSDICNFFSIVSAS